MPSEDRLGAVNATWDRATPSWPVQPQPPQGAPNVVIVLLDDVGFSQLGCYGSDIETPVIDSLAAGGLRYNKFTTTALCSPSRACLLTGRNHHAVGMASIAEFVNGFSNNLGHVRHDAAMLQEVLKEHGYNTFAVGKWHLVGSEAQSMAGPFSDWPLGRGFDRYYGFLPGDTNHWNPTLVCDNHPVDAPAQPEDGYHLTADLIDHAIQFITDQQSVAPGKPFFCYVALGAGHSPHHAFPEDIARYRGRYDHGWDVARSQYFERQKELGIIPPDATLTDRSEGIPAWEDLPAEHQRLYSRMMEIYAAYLTHADTQLGRLVELLQRLEQFENTLFIVLSDNGASAEGGDGGLLNQWTFFNGVEVSAGDMLDHIDELGGPTTFNHYPIGWAHAGNTPFQWYKRWVHAGGVRTPLIVHWPAGIADGGAVRDQYHHVNDLTPTVLEAIGVPQPEVVRGIPQVPIDGVSMIYTFSEPDAPTAKRVQYYEMFGNRAVWMEGWKAVALHQRELTTVRPQSFRDDHWALYHVDADFSEATDLSEAEPHRLEALIDAWWREAEANNVLPLDDRLLGRDDRVSNRQRYVFYRDAAPINPFAVGHVHSSDHTISTQIQIPPEGCEGVILSLGGRFGGWALLVQDRRLVYEYNFGNISRYRIESEPLEVGEHRLQAKVELGKGCARVQLIVDEQHAAAGTVKRIFPYVMGLEPLTCGYEAQTPVSDTYAAPFRFTGGLAPVVVELAEPGGPRFRTHEEIVAVLTQE